MRKQEIYGRHRIIAGVATGHGQLKTHEARYLAVYGPRVETSVREVFDTSLPRTNGICQMDGNRLRELAIGLETCGTDDHERIRDIGSELQCMGMNMVMAAIVAKFLFNVKKLDANAQ